MPPPWSDIADAGIASGGTRGQWDKPSSSTGFRGDGGLAERAGETVASPHLIAPRKFPPLVLAAGLLFVMACLGWLVLGLAGNRTGMRDFPDKDGSVIEVMQEGEDRLSLGEVIAMPEEKWQPWDGQDYIRTTHGSAVWLRATLRNPDARLCQGVLADSEYFPDRLEAWVEEETDDWREMRSGEASAGNDKPMWGRLAAFPITVPAQGERVVYLRAEDYYYIYIHPRWWPQAEDYFAAQVRDLLAECICYGGLVALVLYNLVLWVRLRSPDTGWYVLYAAGAVTFNFISNGGLAFLGFAAGSPWKEMIVVSSLSLSGIFLVQFGRTFLGTREAMPKADSVLRYLRWGLTVFLLGVPFMPWMTGLHWLGATIVMCTLAHAALLVAAVMAWRRGMKHARFFVAAFGLLFLGAMPAVVSWLNQDMQASAARGLLAGSLLEMMMLSFAVADRFAQVQRQLVEETEHRRMLEEAYSDELELEVKERTRELERANADKDQILDVIGHDLRGPLTGLMRSGAADDGEFAKETARTGRALLLVIEDLVLWARLRADTHVIQSHPASALVVPAVVLHRTLAEHDGIALEVEVPEDLMVRTDLVLAQTLVRNLLANALKFAATRVVLSAQPDGEGGVRFTVGNDGAPLSAEVAARFAAGEHEPMTATGGLGLRLCREICHALGMKLTARADGDRGTEFGFTLLAEDTEEHP